MKDVGSPLRPMTPEDERLLQSILAQMQQRFLSVVRERRPGLSDETLHLISDGRILTADQALQAGLVDRIGYLEEAVHTAKRHAGVTEARVVMYRRPQEFAENVYSRSGLRTPQVNLVNLDLGSLLQPPRFMYLWLPTIE